jgi:dolichol kinase
MPINCSIRSKYGLDSSRNSELIEELIATDIDAYGEEWTDSERRRTIIFMVCLILIWMSLIYIDATVMIRPDIIFWSKIIAQNILLAMVFFVCGYSVIFHNLNEAYSRKICHVFAYALPVSLHILWTQRESEGQSELPDSIELTWTCWFQFIPFLALIKPVRRKSSTMMVIFRAIDRIKDRPYTLTWMTTQLLGNYAAILFLHLYLASQEDKRRVKLAILPMCINVFGDGLAEPVGLRWGKNKYTTSALWYKGSFCSGNFERSYEGSACVYFVTLLSLIPFYSLFTATQFAFNMIFLPPAMTLCEAWAPHTWDNPFLTAVCGVFLIFNYEIVP